MVCMRIYAWVVNRGLLRRHIHLADRCNCERGNNDDCREEEGGAACADEYEWHSKAVAMAMVMACGSGYFQCDHLASL